MREIKIGKKYRHFKGKEYKVLHIAFDSENPEHKLVVYKALYGDNLIWVRDYEMFCSLTDKEKYPEIEQKYRFEEIA